MNSPRVFHCRPLFLALASITGFLALSIAPLRADTPALSMTSPGSGTVGGATVGWGFTSSTPVSLTQLGVWDKDGDGLLASHKVTVWDSIGNIIAQLVVPSGTNPLVDGFRYAALTTPILLPAGTYTIGAFYASAGPLDPVAIRATTISMATGFTYGGTKSIIADAFPATNVFGDPNSYFGPNLQFTNATNAVPESGATLWLLGVAALALCALRRREARAH